MIDICRDCIHAKEAPNNPDYMLCTFNGRDGANLINQRLDWDKCDARVAGGLWKRDRTREEEDRALVDGVSLFVTITKREGAE